LSTEGAGLLPDAKNDNARTASSATQ
jgi:hypothetical protein